MDKPKPLVEQIATNQTKAGEEACVEFVDNLLNSGSKPEPDERDILLKRADDFVTDVLPQIGGICIQDYANLNMLCIGLTKWKSQNK